MDAKSVIVDGQAQKYLKSLNLCFPPKTDEEALAMIINSHRWLRREEVRRNDFWNSLSPLKKWILSKLGISLWP
jgi:hypothetical protein